MSSPLLEQTPAGLYCAEGQFHIDPWTEVDHAVITHGHADHARTGSKHYVTSAPGEGVLRARMGAEASIEALGYGETVVRNGVRISLHPAGHVLGSSQIRVEFRGEVWVVSGDYKVQRDPTCAAFEPVRCHTFITESTFGLPIYRWPDPAHTMAGINGWWRANQAQGKASVIFAYSLGKAQRLLAGLDPSIGPIYCHGAIQNMNEVYRAAGVALPETLHAGEAGSAMDYSRSLILAPPSTDGSSWMRKFGPVSDALASGWMRIRGTRRRRALDRGFVMSDHADWAGLLSAIEETGAERVWVTHGYRAPLVRWLNEHGREARAVETWWEGERDNENA